MWTLGKFMYVYTDWINTIVKTLSAEQIWHLWSSTVFAVGEMNICFLCRHQTMSQNVTCATRKTTKDLSLCMKNISAALYLLADVQDKLATHRPWSSYTSQKSVWNTDTIGSCPVLFMMCCRFCCKNVCIYSKEAIYGECLFDLEVFLQDICKNSW